MAAKTPPTTRPSVATTFSFELIETILLQIPVTDLIVASAFLPPFWRSVLQSSTKLSRLVTDATRHAFVFIQPHKWIFDFDKEFNFSTSTDEGLLLACRRINGNEGFVLLRKGTVTILDPATKVARYTEKPEANRPVASRAKPSASDSKGGFGFMELRDMDGNVRVKDHVDSSARLRTDVMWYYLSNFGTRRTDGGDTARGDRGAGGEEAESKGKGIAGRGLAGLGGVLRRCWQRFVPGGRRSSK